MFAEKLIARFNLTYRISFQQGCYTDDHVTLETAYDVAWISHNLHGEGPEDAEKIIGNYQRKKGDVTAVG